MRFSVDRLHRDANKYIYANVDIGSLVRSNYYSKADYSQEQISDLDGGSQL